MDLGLELAHVDARIALKKALARAASNERRVPEFFALSQELVALQQRRMRLVAERNRRAAQARRQSVDAQDRAL